MTYLFKCPAAISEDSFHRFLLLREQVMNLCDDRLTLDCAGLKFVDPLGLCLLHHWFSELQERAVDIELAQLRFTVESYVARMDLFKILKMYFMTIERVRIAGQIRPAA